MSEADFYWADKLDEKRQEVDLECKRCKRRLPAGFVEPICERCESKALDRADYGRDVIEDYLDRKGR